MSLYNHFLQQASQKYSDRGNRARMINELSSAHFANLNRELDQTRKDNQEAVAAARSTALAQMAERNAQLRRQADTRLSAPPRAPNIVPTFNPLEQTVDVNTDAELSGNNAATQSYFITPKSAQSQFSITTPFGGGITGRNRPSTGRLTSESDTLGSKQKDEL